MLVTYSRLAFIAVNAASALPISCSTMAAARVRTAATETLTSLASRSRVPLFMSERSVPDEQAIIDSIQVLRHAQHGAVRGKCMLHSHPS